MVILQVNADNMHILARGSPPPTLPCPYCLRHFKTKSGRTRHIQTKHGAELQAPNLATHPSPQPSDSASAASSRPSPRPSLDIFNAEPIDINDQSDQNSIVSEHGEELEVHQNFPPGDDPNVRDCYVPGVPQITRAYHPKLDGVLDFSLIYLDINLTICRADL